MPAPKQVRRLQDGIDDLHMRFLLCAGPGFGKTVLFGTDDNVLFLATDPEGTVSSTMLGSNAMEWEIKSWSDLTEAYVYLRDGGIKELGLDKGGWVVLDNISEAQELGKHANIALERKRNDKVDEFVPSQANYQRTQNMLLMLVKQFNDLPVNMGYTAWIATHEDNDGVEYYAPAIHGQQGAIAQMVAGYMNIVGYGEVVEDGDGNEHRRIWFSHHGPFRGKDRFVTLGKSRTDLTLPKMNQLVQAAIKKRRAEKSGVTTGASKRPTARRTTTPRKRTA
jgi:hypothetical protein